MPRTWSIAMRADPATPILRIRFRRPWFSPLGRVDVEPLTEQGRGWAEVVEFVLYGDTVHDPERRRFLEPPHTRSALRVELALATITGADRAIVCYRGDGPAPPRQDRGPLIPLDWLRRRVEVANTSGEAAAAAPGAEWEALRREMREGDELWEFESDPGSWRALRGRAGYVVLRNGEPVTMVVTRLS